MSRVGIVSEWETVVSRQLPHLSRPQARVLALWSLGIALAQRCGQTSVVTALAPLLGQAENTVRQRLREWLYDAPTKTPTRPGAHRCEVEVTTCFTPLLRWVLAWWTPTTPGARRLALALDASLLSDRFTVLAVSVLYRSCAIPVAWVVLRANQAEAWRPHWERLLRLLRDAAPADWFVVALADRGLYAPWLFAALVANGWHPFLRITTSPGSTGLYRLRSGGGWRPLSGLLPAVGAAWVGAVVCFQEHPVTCTLLARWEVGYASGWVVVTDLEPALGEVAWYALRGWIEAGFKDTKRGGWQWQATRMTDPARVTRFWLALAVATLWVVSVGSGAEEALASSALAALPLNHAARRQATGRSTPRLVSCFRRGVVAIAQALWLQRPLPLGRFHPDPWPTNQTLESRALTWRAASSRQKTYP